MSHRYWIVGVIVAAIILVIGIPAGRSYLSTKTVTTEVITKERVCDGNGNGGVECAYMIFTEAGEFEISDALIGTVRFNSASVYGKIREGRTYVIEYYGWRVPFLSMFPNVKSITEVPS